MGGKPLDPDYMKKYYRKHRKKLIEAEKRRYEKNRATPAGRAKIKAQREKQHFGYTHAEIFTRLGNRCMRCGDPAELVHHKQGDGRTKEKMKLRPGKRVETFEVLCRACHINEHRAELLAGRAAKAATRWGRDHKGTIYSACICCGRSDISYQGKGLCRNCHARKSRARSL